MIKKEYYRLNDLNRYFGITLDDIRYWIERGVIPLKFHRTDAVFVIGDPESQLSFCGHGYVFYDGLVELYQYHDTELIKNGFTTTYNVYLCERERIEFIDIHCPQAIAPPNQYIKSWEAKHPDQIQGEYFLAMENHDVVQSKSIEKNSITNGFLIKLDSNSPELHIEVKPVRYELEQICITEESLLELGVIESDLLTCRSKAMQKSNDEQILTEQKSMPRHRFANQFQELLARIVNRDRTLKPKQIHRILSNECKIDEDERTFDTDHIMLDCVNGVLVWKDIHSMQPEKNCQIGTLRNHLTEVRRILNTPE
jgi:hypothetical protein